MVLIFNYYPFTHISLASIVNEKNYKEENCSTFGSGLSKKRKKIEKRKKIK